MLVEQIEWIKFLLNINVIRRKNISYKKRERGKKKKTKNKNVLKTGEYWKATCKYILSPSRKIIIKFITIFPIIVTMLNKKQYQIRSHQNYSQ